MKWLLTYFFVETGQWSMYVSVCVGWVLCQWVFRLVVFWGGWEFLYVVAFWSSYLHLQTQTWSLFSKTLFKGFSFSLTCLSKTEILSVKRYKALNTNNLVQTWKQNKNTSNCLRCNTSIIVNRLRKHFNITV